MMKVLQEGVGQLIQPPDLNAFRSWNRDKPKAMIDKRMSEAEAVQQFILVDDGRPEKIHALPNLPDAQRAECLDHRRHSDKVLDASLKYWVVDARVENVGEGYLQAPEYVAGSK